MSDSSEKKTIKINPELFKYTNTTRKKKSGDTQPPKIKVKSEPKERNTTTLKRKLLKHIRSYQDEIQKEQREKNSKAGNNTNNISNKFRGGNNLETAESDRTTNFADSMDYLIKLTRELEKRQPNQLSHNYTLKQKSNTPLHNLLSSSYPGSQHETVSLEIPEVFVSTSPLDRITTLSSNAPQNSLNSGRTGPPFQKDPEYGCLKNGKKPTYRTWKNYTQKNYSSPQMIINHVGNVVQSSPSVDATPEQQRIQQIQQRAKITRINEIASSPEALQIKKPESQKISDIIKREQMKKMKELTAPKKLKRPKQCHKTMRRTYRIGRSKVAPRISVLVSNRTIRKNITTQAQLLKQTPIKEVKQYLIKKGLIRVGSIAPNEVLRRMYETAKMMCGEIQNHNPDNLLYNFLNSEGEQ